MERQIQCILFTFWRKRIEYCSCTKDDQIPFTFVAYSQYVSALFQHKGSLQLHSGP